MMTPETLSTAQSLIHTIQEALQPVEQRLRQHAYLQALEEGRLTPPQLRYFVGEQSYIIPSDLRSIALLISRCAAPASQQFFRVVLDGEAAALKALEPLATAIGPQRNGPLHPHLAEEYKQWSGGRDWKQDFPDWEPVHRILFKNGILGIENVGGDIDKVTGRRCTFALFPWNWERGDGCIIRLVAIIDSKGAYRIERGDRF